MSSTLKCTIITPTNKQARNKQRILIQPARPSAALSSPSSSNVSSRGAPSSQPPFAPTTLRGGGGLPATATIGMSSSSGNFRNSGQEGNPYSSFAAPTMTTNNNDNSDSRGIRAGSGGGVDYSAMLGFTANANTGSCNGVIDDLSALSSALGGLTLNMAQACFCACVYVHPPP